MAGKFDSIRKQRNFSPRELTTGRVPSGGACCFQGWEGDLVVLGVLPHQLGGGRGAARDHVELSGLQERSEPQPVVVRHLPGGYALGLNSRKHYTWEGGGRLAGLAGRYAVIVSTSLIRSYSLL